MTNKKLKVLAFAVSEETFRDLQIWADAFRVVRSEILRNWVEDVLAFLKDGTLEMDDRTRRLQVKKEG